MKFVDPKNDVAFKKIFGNEEKKEILISFLNAVLDLRGDREIEDLEILNPFQAPKIEGLKYTLLDVKAKDKRGITFIVEMQIEQVAGLTKRFLYYASKAYVDQIEQGEDYPKLNQVIFIGILDFVSFEGEDYLTRHLILNNNTRKQEIKDLEFNFIELPKFSKDEAHLETILEKWIYFIKHASNLEVMPPSADTAALQAAYEAANKFSWRREELEVYDYWSIKAQDERGAIQYAFQRALAEGRQEGRQEQALEIARTMRQEGLDLALIAKITGLSAEELAALPGEQQG